MEFLQDEKVNGKPVLDPNIGKRIYVFLPTENACVDLDDRFPGDYDHPYEVRLDMRRRGSEHYDGIEHGERDKLETLEVRAQQKLESPNFTNFLLMADKLSQALSNNQEPLQESTHIPLEDLQLTANLRKISDEVRSALEKKGDGTQEEENWLKMYRNFAKVVNKTEKNYKELYPLAEAFSGE